MNFSDFLASFKYPHSAAQSASLIIMATVVALSFWRGEGTREVPQLEERTKRLEQSQTVTPSGESSGRR
jgi:hypothetical protein